MVRLAAADPSGDASLLWRAAERLGVPRWAAAPAVEAGLAEFGVRVWFRHPLLRSAAYRSASAQERQAIHLALAEATDPAVDPDRQAWHRAQAAAEPDEEVAAELERSAARAEARGGPQRSRRSCSVRCCLPLIRHGASSGSWRRPRPACRPDPTGRLDLLATAEAEPLEELQSARVHLLRGHIAFASGMGGDAPPQLLKAARPEPLDLDLSRHAYLDAWLAAVFAGRLTAEATLLEPAALHEAAATGRSAEQTELVLDALTLLVTDGPGTAAPALRRRRMPSLPLMSPRKSVCG